MSAHDIYDRYWAQRGRSGNRPRFDTFAAWIEPGTSVVDIGCGDGRLGEDLVRARGVTYLGLDVSMEAVAMARERGLEVRQADVTAELDTFDEDSFDYAVVSEFIEHVVDAEAVMLGAARMARRAVLVSMPNIAYWRHRVRLLAGRFPKQWAFDPREHLRYWSVRDFHDWVDDIGLRVEAVEASNGTRLLRRWWPNLFGVQVCFRLVRAA